MKKFIKEHKFNLIMIILILIGIAIVAYPTISDYWNSKVQSKAISDYEDKVRSAGAELQKYKADAQIYNQALYNLQKFGSPVGDYVKKYEDILNISENGMMGYIEIPLIDVKLPIYHGTDDDVLQVAIGHNSDSSVPVGGKNTHAVLLGHRGLPSARLFNDIDQMTKGDYFELHILDEVLTYEVYKVEIVRPEELSKLRIVDGEDIVTLVTCTPYGVNTHRLLVYGKRIDNKNGKTLIFAEARKTNPTYVAIAMGVVLWIMVMSLILYWSNKTLHKSISRKESIRRREILENYKKRKG